MLSDCHIDENAKMKQKSSPSSSIQNKYLFGKVVCHSIPKLNESDTKIKQYLEDIAKEGSKC